MMETVHTPQKSSEPAKSRNSDGKTLAEAPAAGSDLLSSVDGGVDNDIVVSVNGKEALGDAGLVGMIKTRAVDTEMAVDRGFRYRNVSGVSGTDHSGVEDSEIDGVGSLLTVNGGSVRGFGGEDCGDSVKEMDSVAEKVQEAFVGDLGDVHGVPAVDSDKGDGVEESKDLMMDMEDDTDEGDDLGGEGCDFNVGDFVWGKIKSHPWWPGQIYDASDASESAAKRKQKGRFLIGFSDGSFAWCLPSQLKPFEENFEDMLKQSNSKSFVSAVGNALNDIAELLELKMTCSCVLKGSQEDLGRPLAENTGIMEGVFVPEGGLQFSITEFQPTECISNLKNVAQVASVASMHDLVILKSCLSAFYRAKGGYQLPEYYEPQPIPGLEDLMEETMIYDGAVEVPVQGPFEEDWVSSKEPHVFGESNLTVSQDFPGNREDQLHLRKQKSIAEIIAKGGTGSGKLALTSGRKRRKANDETNANGIDNTSDSTPKTKEYEVSGPFATPKSKLSNGNNIGRGDQGTKKRGRKKKEDSGSGVASNVIMENGHNQGTKKRGRKKKGDSGSGVASKVDLENGLVPTERKEDGRSKEQNDKSYVSRERKKSKYLSPPYTNPTLGMRREESDAESLEVVSATRVRDHITKTPGRINGYPLVKCSDPLKIGLLVNDVLSEIRSAALFSLYQVENEALDTVAEFLGIYRSSTYLNGSHYEVYKQQQEQEQPGGRTQQRRGRKRKSVNAESELGKNLNQNGHIVPERRSQERKMIRNREAAISDKTKPRRAVGKSDSKTNNNSSAASASLFVTFGPGSSLPTKTELIGLYKKFGELVENETDMFYNNFCARVVFVRSSDAEEALKSSQESSPFGSANVTFRILNTPAAPKTQALNETSRPDGEPSELNVVKRKLEMMATMVEQSDGKMSPKLKSKLEGEMRGLLEKVSSMD